MDLGTVGRKIEIVTVMALHSSKDRALFRRLSTTPQAQRWYPKPPPRRALRRLSASLGAGSVEQWGGQHIFIYWVPEGSLAGVFGVHF